MGFDKSKFLKSGFVPRTGEVQVPDLADYFQDGAPAVWKIRGLTGPEVGRVNEAVEKTRNLNALAEGLLSPKTADQVDAIRKLTGFDESAPSDIIKRLKYLMIGSVDPGPDMVDQDFAGRVCQFFPIEFYTITNEIIRLTGLGHVPGKPRSSGTTEESKPA